MNYNIICSFFCKNIESSLKDLRMLVILQYQIIEKFCNCFGGIYIPIYAYNCVIFELGYLHETTIIGDTVFSAFSWFCSLILSLSSTFFVYKDMHMHIIYNLKAFEKGFQMNVNTSRNISNTFQSTLKNSEDINWSIFVRMSDICIHVL